MHEIFYVNHEIFNVIPLGKGGAELLILHYSPLPHHIPVGQLVSDNEMGLLQATIGKPDKVLRELSASQVGQDTQYFALNV